MSAFRSSGKNLIGRAFAIFGAAASAAAAVEGHRRPTSRDLQTLGIDPAKFNAIR